MKMQMQVSIESYSVLGGGQWFLMINYVHDVNEKINFIFNKISHVLNIYYLISRKFLL